MFSTNRLKSILIPFTLIIGVLCSFLLHVKSGMNFPIPWGDEAFFLWPAVNLAENGTLLAPQLNPIHHIMWMPPGYMIFISGIYKFLGGNPLVLGRTVSWFLIVISSFIMYSFLTRSSIRKEIAALISSTFLVLPPIVAISNVARMDSLLLVVILGGFLSLRTNRFELALILFLISPLIHPNGVYFLVSGFFCFFLISSRPHKHAIYVFFVALIPWALYSWYICAHWNDFVYQMQFQFVRKAERSIWVSISKTQNILFLISILVITIWTWYQKNKTNYFILIFSSACLVVYVIGNEMWYQLFYIAGTFLLLAIMMEIFITFFLSKKFGQFNLHSEYLFTVMSIAICCVITLMLIKGEIGWQGMTFRTTPYYEQEELNYIKRLINQKVALSRVKNVIFFPVGESLLYYSPNTQNSNWNPFVPLFYDFHFNCLEIFHINNSIPAAMRMNDSISFNRKSEVFNLKNGEIILRYP